jgi:hypothetical protein
MLLLLHCLHLIQSSAQTLEDLLTTQANQLLDQALQASGVKEALQPISQSLVTNIGLSWEHRSTDPASTLTEAPLGLAVGLVVHLSKADTSILETLGRLTGNSAASTAIPLPQGKLQITKSISSFMQLEYTLLPSIPQLQGLLPVTFFAHGGAVQLSLAEGRKEGRFNYAVRLGYSHSGLSANMSPYHLSLTTSTFSPALVISKPLAFWEPYVGLGFAVTRGKLSASLRIEDIPGVDIPSALSPYLPDTLSIALDPSTASNGSLFFGLAMNTPLLPLRITLEGAWRTNNMHGLGLKTSLIF